MGWSQWIESIGSFPGYNFLGPNPFGKGLESNVQPVNPLDFIAQVHDSDYEGLRLKYRENPKRYWNWADEKMLRNVVNLKRSDPELYKKHQLAFDATIGFLSFKKHYFPGPILSGGQKIGAVYAKTKKNRMDELFGSPAKGKKRITWHDLMKGTTPNAFGNYPTNAPTPEPVEPPPSEYMDIDINAKFIHSKYQYEYVTINGKTKIKIYGRPSFDIYQFGNKFRII